MNSTCLSHFNGIVRASVIRKMFNFLVIRDWINLFEFMELHFFCNTLIRDNSKAVYNNQFNNTFIVKLFSVDSRVSKYSDQIKQVITRYFVCNYNSIVINCW